jgi:uncharacterized membrane protein YhfC
MENIDFSQTIPSGTQTMISAGGILLISVIIVMTIIVAKRWHGRFIPFLMGIVCYALLVWVVSNFITSALGMIPSIDIVFKNDPTTYTIIYCILTTIGFAISRPLMAHMFTERYERKGDIYLAGIALGVGDSILFGISAISSITWCNAIQQEGLESILSTMSAEQAEQTYNSISTLFTSPDYLWLLLAISCILDIILNVAFMIMVYGAATNQAPKMWYYITAVINLVAMLSFQLYDPASPFSIALSFAIKIVVFAASVYYIFKVAAREIKYNDD